MRIARFVAPSLVVLLLGGVLVVVLVSSGGSAKSACPGVGSGVKLSASELEHCRHSAAAVAQSNPGQAVEAGGVEGRGRGAGASRSGSSAHLAVSGIAGAVNASDTGGSGATEGTAAGNGGTAAGGTGTTGAGSPSQAGASGSKGAVSPATSVAAGGAGSSTGLAADGVLAPGRTETGSWATQSATTLPVQLEPHFTTATITFPVHLKHGLHEGAVTYVDEAETKKPATSRTAAIRAACGESGTLEAPTANPGYLCVYSGGEDFRDRDPSGGVPTHSVHGSQAPFVDAEYVAIIKHDISEGADKWGAAVAFGFLDVRTPEEEAADAIPHVAAHGTWAVTGA